MAKEVSQFCTKKIFILLHIFVIQLLNMANNKHILSIELTTVLVEDKKTGHYSAFFAQFPEAIAYGRNEDEAEINLYDIFAVMLRDKKNEVLRKVEGEEGYKSKQINLATA
jgi:predicted RNase H-like HicB family nuclease